MFLQTPRKSRNIQINETFLFVLQELMDPLNGSMYLFYKCQKEVWNSMFGHPTF